MSCAQCEVCLTPDPYDNNIFHRKQQIAIGKNHWLSKKVSEIPTTLPRIQANSSISSMKKDFSTQMKLDQWL